MKSILYDTQKSENSKNYQHKFTNFCNIITSQTYKKGGETIEKNMFFTNQVTYMHYTTGKKTRYITTKTLHVVQKLFI